MTMLSTVKFNSTRIAAVILVAASVAYMAPATAQTKAASACPANFISLDTIWYNNANKAIISIASGSSTSTEVVTDRPGWTLSDLCQHTETGDIQIFDRKPSGNQAASVRN
jgi:hypothetical protein